MGYGFGFQSVCVCITVMVVLVLVLILGGFTGWGGCGWEDRRVEEVW